ncbi:hypothetical protein P280DRAFT_453479 [Massarina eburnea CBS 473.64]|uniref:Uncharacterized protein n=1 Tax=Massarina eburnea CBS 473.64 TaxID=1395130 RepID=A0A6A6RWS5_9PLEO|nr:hypothetical protein P280DRAFT_453479 [Massarina eburnea CBS 473.64]
MVTTRRKTYGEAPARLSTLSDRRRRWAALLRGKHYQPVIAEVLEQELPKYATSALFLPNSMASITRECVLILASAPLIFAAAVEGTLTQRFLVDVDLQREYQVIQERAHIQPSIYLQLLADEHGTPPTAKQYLIIRERMLQYVSSGTEYQELAWAIDNITPPNVAHSATITGYRKYLWTKKRSPAHLERIFRLSTGIMDRYNSIPPSDRTDPLPFPPCECGYSYNSHIRLAQHRNRQSSNYVMNLIEDICGHLHNTSQFTQRFSMHQYIIYLIFHPEQAAIAEIFCSGLLQVWVDDGGGVNAYPAGRSVASASRISVLEWAAHERWTEENTELRENLRVQMERLERDVKGLDDEVGEVWREALDEERVNGEELRDGDYVPDE